MVLPSALKDASNRPVVCDMQLNPFTNCNIYRPRLECLWQPKHHSISLENKLVSCMYAPPPPSLSPVPPFCHSIHHRPSPRCVLLHSCTLSGRGGISFFMPLFRDDKYQVQPFCKHFLNGIFGFSTSLCNPLPYPSHHAFSNAAAISLM